MSLRFFFFFFFFFLNNLLSSQIRTRCPFRISCSSQVPKWEIGICESFVVLLLVVLLSSWIC
ncbi:hypothetical protein BDV35DRAFT_7659 [Aspergillus flavus]|uniref:Uncharacterized protein n=1 Tax=Aspergillus flavus TaxID=5059 RepID=A0A5N6HAJ7_ASPFL|nr:hypothetical protein BDV35DRAFT_7659 [Aspergillus flavus]